MLKSELEAKVIELENEILRINQTRVVLIEMATKIAENFTNITTGLLELAKQGNVDYREFADTMLAFTKVEQGEIAGESSK